MKKIRFSLNPIVLTAVVTLAMIAGCAQPKKITRFGNVIGISKENISEYKRLHENCWPGVLKTINKANIHDFSIYLGEAAKGQYYLFSYYEYTGRNFDADMKKMADDKITQNWWKHTDPLQQPLATRKKTDKWWSTWEEVFHYDGPAANIKGMRHASIVGLNKDSVAAYKQLQSSVWPGVLAAYEKANIRNYSIYLGEIEEDNYLLFSYFEYVGDDYEGDMKGMAADEIVKKWWAVSDSMQTPLPTRKEGEWWESMEEVFHTD